MFLLFDAAISDLDKAVKDFQTLIASGKDFGPIDFKVSYKYQVLKGADVLKASSNFPFEYAGGNTRVETEDVIKMDTQFAASVSGNENVVIPGSDAGSGAIVIDGFKLYNEDKTPSDADFIKGIEATTVDNKLAVNVSYKATQGVNPGKFYALVSFHPKGDTETFFDLVLHLEHKTK